MINNAYLNRVFADLQKNHPNEPEFLQAVDEVFESLQYVVDKLCICQICKFYFGD